MLRASDELSARRFHSPFRILTLAGSDYMPTGAASNHAGTLAPAWRDEPFQAGPDAAPAVELEQRAGALGVRPHERDVAAGLSPGRVELLGLEGGEDRAELVGAVVRLGPAEHRERGHRPPRRGDERCFAGTEPVGPVGRVPVEERARARGRARWRRRGAPPAGRVPGAARTSRAAAPTRRCDRRRRSAGACRRAAAHRAPDRAPRRAPSSMPGDAGPAVDDGARSGGRGRARASARCRPRPTPTARAPPRFRSRAHRRLRRPDRRACARSPRSRE